MKLRILGVLAIAAYAGVSAGHAASVTTLVSFSYTATGHDPTAGLIADAAGDLFGITDVGGANGEGTVFEIAKTGGTYSSTPTTLVTFNGSNGEYPFAGLIADAAGDLFGTTIDGGANGDGTVFEIPKASSGYGTLTILVSFNGSNGSNPYAGLIADAAGDLFGTTDYGGANGEGTVFEIPKITSGYGTLTTLVSFNGTNGKTPEGTLIADAAGDLFGTTAEGGANGGGTVFEIVKTGPSYASTPTTLVNFNGGEGSTPDAGLVADASGNLFGTASQGGANGYGTVFELMNNGGGYTLTTLVSFNGSDGQYPLSGLIVDAVGDLFGTTYRGGNGYDGGANSGDGSVFEIVKAGGSYASTPTTLVNFSGANGEFTSAGLIADAAEDLFGTTNVGGANGDGTVFEIIDSGFVQPVRQSAYITGSDVSVIDTATNTVTTTIPLASFGVAATRDGNKVFVTDAGGVSVIATATNTVIATIPISRGALTVAVTPDGSKAYVVNDASTSGVLNNSVSVIAAATNTVTGTISVGKIPDSVAVSPDGGTVYVTNNGGNTVSVIATATDTVTATIPVGLFPTGVAVAPDGSKVYVANNGGHSVSVIATATDTVTATIPIGRQAFGLAVTPDGSKVYVTSYTANTVSVIATATNTVTATIPVGAFPQGVAATPDGSKVYVANTDSNTVSVIATATDTVTSTIPVGNSPAAFGVFIARTKGATSDFNADGKSDILWQNTSGQAAIWLMNGTTPTITALVGANSGPSWQVIGAGDFYGSLYADILWQNTDGQVAIWEMNGTTATATALVGANPGPSWQAIATGDFNGDGKSDILFQNTSGQAAIWLMNGAIATATALVGANPGPSWHVIGTGDFNGDGKSDILFQNTSGQVAIWLMDGTTPTTTALVRANPGTSWHVIGSGDFYGDGYSDILWQNTNGDVAIWEMDGTSVIASSVIGNPGPSWHAIGVGDFNGDGHSDILLQNTSGEVWIWEMNGIKIVGSGSPGSPAPSWHAIGE